MFSSISSYMSSLVLGTEQSRLQNELETQRKGNYRIAYEMENINFEHLRRKRAFVKGINIQVEEEKTDKGQTLGFDTLPDLLPIKPKNQKWDVIDYDKLLRGIVPQT